MDPDTFCEQLGGDKAGFEGEKPGIGGRGGIGFRRGKNILAKVLHYVYKNMFSFYIFSVRARISLAQFATN